MSLRSPGCRLLLLFGVLLFTGACGASNSTMTSPSASATLAAAPSLSAEPATLSPEFLPQGACAANPPFGTRIIIIVNGGSRMFVHDMHFRFSDDFGGTALPRVSAIPGASPMTTPILSIPTSYPIPPLGAAPMPTTYPIPSPAASDATARTSMPFLLTFDCGVFSRGTLWVGVNTGDDTGKTHSSELRVRVGS